MKKKKPEFYLSLFAIAISFVATAISLWQLELTREHNKLSVRPKLLITPYLEGPGGRNGIYLQNAGLGPGTIVNFEVQTAVGTYSGLNNQKWEPALEKIGINSKCFAKGWPNKESTLKAGEKEKLLEISKGVNALCYREILNLLQKGNVTIQVSYKSMYEEQFSSESTILIKSKELEEIKAYLDKVLK